MPLLVTLFILFISILHLYHNWRIQPHSLYLSAALAIIALMFVTHYYFIYGTSVVALAFLFIHFTPLHFLFGPFLLFYVTGTLSDRHRLRRRDAWHFLPALLDLISRLEYYWKPWSYKLGLASEMVLDVRRLHEIGDQFFPPTHVILPLRFVSMIGYTVFSLWLVYRFSRHYPAVKRIPKADAQTVIRFLQYMLWTCLMAELSFGVLVVRFFGNRELDASHFINNPWLILSTLGIVSIPLLMQTHPRVLYGIPRWNAADTGADEDAWRPVSPESGTTTIQASPNALSQFEELAIQIPKFMEDRQPWLDPDFSLETLADQMKVPRHHLYYCFNNILNTRFIQMRSAYRVRHAQKLIDQGATREKTLEAIGLESGFSTRGTFITAFREVAGMTPREYLRSREGIRV